MLTAISFCAAIAIMALRRPFPRSALVPLVLSLPVMHGWELLFGAQGTPVAIWPWLFVSMPAFALGVVVQRRTPNNAEDLEPNMGAQRTGNIAVAIIAMLTLLHFARAGIPVLSAGVETVRFDFSVSGLGGIPSRAVLFSLPILVLASVCRKDLFSSRAAHAALLLLLLSRIALGFKGGLLEVVVLLLLAFMVSGKRIKVRHVLIGAFGSLTAIAYATVIGARYSTIRMAGGISWDYYIDRISIQSARPGQVLMSLGQSQIFGGSAWMNDVMYFLGRYAHRPTGVNFASDQIVSSILTGTPRSSTNFLVPVTTGAAPYLLASMGVIAAMLCMGALGWLWQTAVLFIRCRSSATAPLVGAALLLGVQVAISNGGLVYLAVNETVGLLIILMALWIPMQLRKLRGLSGKRG